MNGVFYFIIFLFGASIGSFLNVVILRLPKEESLSKKRSHCPSCGKLIYWYENIPIFSFLFLRGKCSACQTKISWQYPLVEFLFGIFALALLPRDLQAASSWVSFCFRFSIISTFFCMTMIDLRHRIIPDSLNLYLGLNLLLMSVFHYSWEHYVFGALIGLAFPYAVTWLFYKLRGEIGLGGGDIKLFCALGIFLGPFGIIHNIFFSCFVGAILSGILMIFKVISRKTPVPFGPFIVFTGCAQIFFPDYFNKVLRLLIL